MRYTCKTIGRAYDGSPPLLSCFVTNMKQRVEKSRKPHQIAFTRNKMSLIDEFAMR